MASYRRYITRMHFLPFSLARKQKEWITIQHIAKVDNFPRTPTQRINSQLQQTLNNPDRERNKTQNSKIRKKFRYYSSLLCKITNLFKRTNITIAFRSTNTIYEILQNQK